MAARKYKLNQGFITQKLKDKVVIFSGERSRMYTLNETAAYILNSLKLGWSEEKIQDRIQTSYKIDIKTAKDDVSSCINELVKKQIISIK